MIAYGQHTFFHFYTNDIFSFLVKQRNVRDNPHCITYLVRYVFHQLFSILNAINSLVIFNAKPDYPTFGIGVTTNPSQVVIAPDTLIFHIL